MGNDRKESYVTNPVLKHKLLNMKIHEGLTKKPEVPTSGIEPDNFNKVVSDNVLNIEEQLKGLETLISELKKAKD